MLRAQAPTPPARMPAACLSSMSTSVLFHVQHCIIDMAEGGAARGLQRTTMSTWRHTTRTQMPIQGVWGRNCAG